MRRHRWERPLPNVLDAVHVWRGPRGRFVLEEPGLPEIIFTIAGDAANDVRLGPPLVPHIYDTDGNLIPPDYYYWDAT